MPPFPSLRIHLTAVFIFFIFVNSSAQNDPANPYFSEIGKQVDSLVQIHFFKLNQSSYSSDKPDNSMFLAPVSYTDSMAQASSSMAYYESEKYRKDIGLRLTGNFTNNFSDGFEELGFFYRRSVQAGFDWNLMQSGWLENDRKAREIQYKQRVADLLFLQQKKNVSQDWERQDIARLFDASRVALLKDRTLFVAQFLDIQKKMYSYKIILWEEILKTLSTQSQIQLMLSNMEKTAPDTTVIPAEKLPVLALRPLSELIDSASIERRNDTLLYYSRLLARYRYNVSREISLKPFVRYNYYDYAGQVSGNRDFVSAGVSFSMPLPFRNYENKKLQQLNNRQLVFENKKYENLNVQYIKGLYAEYNAILSDLNELIYKEQILKERIRREKVKLSMGDQDYSPVYIARQLDEWYAVKSELIDTKQKLYLKLARIQTAIPDKSISDLTVVQTFDVNREQYSSDQKTFYVWSSHFAEIKNKDLANELKNAGCKRLLLSIDGDNTLKVKLLELLPLLQSYKIQTELMVAKNEYIYAKNNDKLLESVEYLLEIPGINGIHLDIEPHAIDELKAKRSLYLPMYVTMVKSVQQKVKARGLNLSISIPVFYPEDQLKKIFPYVNQVYLMAYERPEVEFIKRKIAEESAIDKSKVVVGLRTKDFSSRSALLDFIQKLKLSTGTSDYAIHDLKGYRELK